MSTTTISTMLKKTFSEFCDVRQYCKQAPEQLVIKKYALGIQKMIVDEEKSNE